ncbi:MAG: hypothetical protein ACTH1D_05290 [Mycobacteriaceae bacterium]|uniref:hypothetical protein n=1 Tax=Corynebacterium sp. TaxID=1720 RepID=UPI003F956E9C
MPDRSPVPPWRNPGDFVAHVEIPGPATQSSVRAEALWRHAVDTGVAGQVWHTPVWLPDPRGRTRAHAASLFIDETVSDEEAGWLHETGLDWARWLVDDSAEYAAVVGAVGTRDVVPLSEFIDADMTGAWLVRGGDADGTGGTPWRLLVAGDVFRIWGR